MTYYIYHIPGKKIGVTCNLRSRVTDQQGYEEGEYDVLDSSTDIDYISKKEISLQKIFGYKVDRTLYSNLKPQTNMNINITGQTTTFPCPLNKLKGQLHDNIGMKWETEHGEISVTPATILWIMKNVKTSMFNNERCYIYNKAFVRYHDSNDLFKQPSIDDVVSAPKEKATESTFDLIREWAFVRGLYAKGDPMTQYVKLQEECGELAKALLKRDEPEVVDAIGDIIVVLTNLAHIKGYTIEDCMESAYAVISKRTGKMVNGTFVKDE
jgi:NTP pyrophosphatase (non-canonical NTP hydrolase)